MQKFQDWEHKFGELGLTCVEVTGDTSVSMEAMAKADIILSTPEKWDSGQQWPNTVILLWSILGACLTHRNG